MYRKQTEQIIKDLEKKMVFLVGPRQVGKTWLSKYIGGKYAKSLYLNYDDIDDRKIIEERQWFDVELLILDEIHKMKKWKNYLKGVYDTKPERMKILVTGSARLETFRQTGDSLAGRFFAHRLMPFSIAEIHNEDKGLADINRFIERGGFPEPFLMKNSVEANRWRNQYIDGLVRDDIMNFEEIDKFREIRMVFELLRRKVGSQISYSSIAQDVGISPNTAKRYIGILESLFIVFMVTPASKKIARSIMKEPRIYFYDTGLVVGDEGRVFENFMGVSLLKSVLAENDSLGKRKKLQYIRDKEGREVDFAIVDNDNDVEEIIEVKLSDKDVSKHLKYFSNKYNFSAVQVVKNLNREKLVDGIKVVRASNYLKDMFL